MYDASRDRPLCVGNRSVEAFGFSLGIDILSERSSEIDYTSGS